MVKNAYGNRGGGLKNKAFTLIELLAVIVILAVIALIVSPIIIKVIGKTKKQAFERSIDGILETVRLDYAVEGFVVLREYFYNKGELILLRIGEEVQNKTIAIKGKIEGSGFIYVDVDGIRIDKVCSSSYCATGKEDNIIITENEEGKIPEYNVTDPMISLNGSETVYVGLNETYIELGAVAKTIGGQVLEYTSEITLDGEVVTSIDTVNENTYVITYQASNEGKTVTTKRNVVVVNMTPVITVTEANTKYVKEQEILITTSAIRPNTITSLTYKIKKGEEVIENETITGNTKTIFLNETGNYEIEVSVTDSGNHTKSMTSGVYKIDAIEPEIIVPENTHIRKTDIATYDLLKDVVVTDNTREEIIPTAEGNLEPTIGEQKITYIAVDEAGNETRKTRLFTIVEAEGPILNFSSLNTNGEWTKAQTITVTATDNSNIKTFTVEIIKDGESEGVKQIQVTGKNAEKNIELTQDGEYQIKLKAEDEYGSKNEEISGIYKIDVTKPEIKMNSVTILDTDVITYDLKTGVTVEDGRDQNPTLIVEGNIGETGKDYIITYKATDEAGNVETKTRTITVTATHDINCVKKTYMVAGKSVTGCMDDTKDPAKNLRYVGSNPSNYVKFNNELWRIIGVFNGNIKLVRNDYIYASKWDENNSNDWSTSTLMTKLKDYWNNTVDEVSKTYVVDQYEWTLGGPPTYDTTTRSDYFNVERSETVYSEHQTKWAGAVALIYPSDYGYSTSATNSECDTVALSAWSETGNVENCRNNSWIKKSYIQWTLTPRSGYFSDYVFRVHNDGRVWPSYATGGDYVLPAVYLKTNVKIKSGTGLSSNPYILGT